MPEIELQDLTGQLDDDILLKNVDRDWQASENYIGSSVQTSWDESLKHWQGKHLKSPRAGRSKLFLRKPRNQAERIKAGLLDAFFSSHDYVSIEPARGMNVEVDVLSAKIRQAYLNYRLSGKPIPWYQLIYSAIDDLAVFNLCVLNIDWVRQIEKISYKVSTPVLNPMTQSPMMDEMGGPLMSEEEKIFTLVIRDEPEIRLIPPERSHIDPRVDWINPYNGQYIIHDDFVTFQDLKIEGRTDPLIDLEAVNDAQNASRYTNAIEQQRKGQSTTDFHDDDRRVLRIWKYWYKVMGKWWIAWTNENRMVIRKPEPNPNKHGLPPYVFGFYVPESHLFYSDSILAINRDYYIAMNAVRNQRFDNVALILNKHLLVDRNANLDLASLINRRPGGVTEGDGNPSTWAHWDEIPDMSSSAYNEEILLDRESQEASGVTDLTQGITPEKQELATQSVLRTQQSNKKESVGVKTVAETLIIPAIRMFLQLADQYENDQTVMQIVGASLGLQMGDDEVPNLFQIQGQHDIKVYAGLGVVSRDVRLQNLDAIVDKISGLYGPLAVLPILEEYLSMAGVRNVKQVLMAIDQTLQMQAATAQEQMKMDAEQSSAKGNGRQPKGNQKPLGERGMTKRLVQGQVEM